MALAAPVALAGVALAGVAPEVLVALAGVALAALVALAVPVGVALVGVVLAALVGVVPEVLAALGLVLARATICRVACGGLWPTRVAGGGPFTGLRITPSQPSSGCRTRCVFWRRRNKTFGDSPSNLA